MESLHMADPWDADANDTADDALDSGELQRLVQEADVDDPEEDLAALDDELMWLVQQEMQDFQRLPQLVGHRPFDVLQEEPAFPMIPSTSEMQRTYAPDQTIYNSQDPEQPQPLPIPGHTMPKEPFARDSRSTRFRQRRKAELRQLREQVVQLQQQLAQLQSVNAIENRNESSSSCTRATSTTQVAGSQGTWTTKTNVDLSSSRSASSSLSVLTTNGHTNAWQRTAQEELARRQETEFVNQKLHEIIRKHTRNAKMIQRLFASRWNWGANDWFSHTALTVPCPRTRWLEQEVRGRYKHSDKLTQLIQATRMHMLLQRVDASFQQFGPGRVLASLTGGLAQTPQPFTFRIVDNDYVELVRSTTTCFDASTVLQLLWKCFSWQAKTQGNDPTAMEAFTSPRQNESSSNRSKTWCEAVEKVVVNDAIHREANFFMVLSDQLQVHVNAYGAVKKSCEMLVWESFGRLERVGSTCKPVEFCRSVCFRPQDLGDGRSVLHQVHRIRPYEHFESTGNSQGLTPDQARAWDRHRLQLQLLGELLQRSHVEMSKHFQSLILEHLCDQAKWCEDSKAWPLHGTM